MVSEERTAAHLACDTFFHLTSALLRPTKRAKMPWMTPGRPSPRSGWRGGEGADRAHFGRGDDPRVKRKNHPDQQEDHGPGRGNGLPAFAGRGADGGWGVAADAEHRTAGLGGGPLVGVGGVGSAEQAWQKIRAGAATVQLYTALVYGGLSLVQEIAEGLDQILAREGFASVGEAVGTGRKEWT